MASVIYQKRSLPIFWIFLPKKGASNLREQQLVLRPIIKLFKTHQIVIVGDREFHSVDLARWIDRQGVKFVLRQKKSTTFRASRRKFTSLSSVQVAPGQREFFSETSLTQKKGFGRFNLAIYWRRKYKNKQEKSPWYLLTKRADLETAVKAYKQRFGIEAMFKDCKSGGYNLEGSQATPDKLVRESLADCPRDDQRLVTRCSYQYLGKFFLYLSAKGSHENLGVDIAIFGSVYMVTIG